MNDERAANKGFSEAAEPPVAEAPVRAQVAPGGDTDPCPLCKIHRKHAGYMADTCGAENYRKPGCFVVGDAPSAPFYGGAVLPPPIGLASATEPALKRATPEVGSSGAASELAERLRRDACEWLDLLSGLNRSPQMEQGVMFVRRLVSALAAAELHLGREESLRLAAEESEKRIASRLVSVEQERDGLREERDNSYETNAVVGDALKEADERLAAVEQRAEQDRDEANRWRDGLLSAAVQRAERAERKLTETAEFQSRMATAADAAEARVADCLQAFQEIAELEADPQFNVKDNRSKIASVARRVLAGVPQ